VPQQEEDLPCRAERTLGSWQCLSVGGAAAQGQEHAAHHGEVAELDERHGEERVEAGAVTDLEPGDQAGAVAVDVGGWIRSAAGPLAEKSMASTHRAVYQPEWSQPICTRQGQIPEAGTAMVLAWSVTNCGSATRVSPGSDAARSARVDPDARPSRCSQAYPAAPATTTPADARPDLIAGR
jgi:hypothetical protein